MDEQLRLNYQQSLSPRESSFSGSERKTSGGSDIPAKLVEMIMTPTTLDGSAQESFRRLAYEGAKKCRAWCWEASASGRASAAVSLCVGSESNSKQGACSSCGCSRRKATEELFSPKQQRGRATRCHRLHCCVAKLCRPLRKHIRTCPALV